MDSARWLTIKAGPAARAALAEGALTPDRIGAVAAAAGGPKWLAIAPFHRTLFADWLSDAHHLPIVGSSIGAWAGAMACHEDDPAGAIDALAQRYIAQSYTEKPDARVITETLAGILDTALTDGVRRGILSNPRFDLHVVTCRSKGLAASDNRLRLGAALGLSAAANLVDRVGLGLAFERVVFARGARELVWANEGFATRTVALSAANLFDALFASGNVPMIMNAVHDPAGAPAGLYRDGGLTDYHIDQPLLAPGASAPIVLMPHFEDRLVPGWLDKRLKWRRPRHADHVLMIGPGPAMREALPGGRVPERRDFYRHAGDDATRQRLWREAMTAGERMRDAFFDLAARDKLVDHVQPL